MDDWRIYHVTKEISQTMGEYWSVEKMAASVKLSLPQFKKLFSEKVGVSPALYLLNLRLEKARTLLSDTHNFLRIKEISSICGLNDESHFTRDFKKKYGMTPTDFRNDCSRIEQENLQYGQE